MPYHNNSSKPSRPKPKKPKKKKTPKGFHRMPNGKLMKGAKHPTKKK
jgi:hypothetical protein